MKRININRPRRWPRGHHGPHHNVLLSLPARRKVGAVELPSRAAPFLVDNALKVELEVKAGSKDDVNVYWSDVIGSTVYVVAINRRMPYFGIEKFELTPEALDTYLVKCEERGCIPGDGPAGGGDAEECYVAIEPVADLFLQNDTPILEVLGKRATALTDATIARRLVARLNELE